MIIRKATLEFKPDYGILQSGELPPELSKQRVIKAEPMFFSASNDFCMENGGPLTKWFCERLPKNQSGYVIDSRTHMLMNGWYPCIPGWHHDDVPRNPSMNNQPDYLNMEYHSRHVMCVVGETAMPQFLNVPVTLDLPENNIYMVWDGLINRLIDPQLGGRNAHVWDVPSGKMIAFGWESFHRGMPATQDGWRWFIRATRMDSTRREIKNEIRAQVQVYLPTLNAGW